MRFFLFSLLKVLAKIIDILPSEPRVKNIVLDFEKAAWAALRDVLPTINIMGCAFHWSQV